jgi:hypothetical protein
MDDIKEKILSWLKEDGIASEEITGKRPPKNEFDPMTQSWNPQQTQPAPTGWAIKATYKGRNFIFQKGGRDWFVLSIGVGISPPQLQRIKSQGMQGLGLFMNNVINQCSQLECSFDIQVEEITPVGYKLKYRIFEHGLVKQVIIRYLECLWDIDQRILNTL